MKRPRRWRFWMCYQGDGREGRAQGAIKSLKQRGFGAKIWAPLPQHKTSGHIHVVILANLNELLELAGIKIIKRG